MRKDDTTTSIIIIGIIGVPDSLSQTPCWRFLVQKGFGPGQNLYDQTRDPTDTLKPQTPNPEP